MDPDSHLSIISRWPTSLHSALPRIGHFERGITEAPPAIRQKKLHVRNQATTPARDVAQFAICVKSGAGDEPLLVRQSLAVRLCLAAGINKDLSH